MLQEDLELVRHLTEHMNENERPPLELFDAEVTFTTRGELMGRSVYRGHDGLLQVFADFREAWDDIRVDVSEFVRQDDWVVAIGTFKLRSHGGVPLEVQEAWAYWLQDGRIVRVEQHATREAALEAVGLAE